LKAQLTVWDKEMQQRWFWKKLQTFIRGRAQRQKCSATLPPIQCQAILISHFELQILLKVSKTVGILAKTPKNEIWVNILTQTGGYADFREIHRAKTLIGASVAEIFLRIFSESALLHLLESFLFTCKHFFLKDVIFFKLNIYQTCFYNILNDFEYLF
jgi:hypothetical protein